MIYKFNIKHSQIFNKKENSALVLFAISNENLNDELNSFENEFEMKIPATLRSKILSEKNNSISFYQEKSPEFIVINKIKLNESFSADHFRNYFASFIQNFENDIYENLYIKIPGFESFNEFFGDEEKYLNSLIEGIHLGNYKFDKYLSERSEEKKLKIKLIGNKKSIENSIKNTENLISGVYFAKDLANAPSNEIYPDSFAKELKKKLESKNTKVTVWKEPEIKKQKMGAVLAVGSGSENKPRFIIINYKPESKDKLKIALVGKGVTFDSGGISIKPSAGMGDMKADMSGAAAVAGTILAIQNSKLPIEIIGVIPAVENMPSGSALKPGDIIRTLSGKSIEVDNTDAEGRLILADALEYASKQNPDYIIDLATLTGACVVALGEYAAGVFTKNDELANKLYEAGKNSYEKVWRLPLWDEYHKLMKSEIADIKNLGGRWAGAITAAKFLEFFVDKNISWAHIDIAGPSGANNFASYTQKYATGFGVRLMYGFIENLIK